VTRRIARRAWRILRPGHTRPARIGREAPATVPPPRWVEKLVDATPPPEVIEDWRVPVWEDDVRAASEAKTRRLREGGHG
jgi:hypothetical protein